MSTAANHTPDDVHALTFYRSVLASLERAGVPVLVGGTYAMLRHAGVWRDTKDLDLFVRRRDWSRLAAALGRGGIECELVYPHWLGKARHEGLFVDLIFAGGNGLVEVDDEWFAHAVSGAVYDRPVKLCPAEEMIWSKCFVMERERFDGADVLHLVRKSGPTLDWARLLRRFEGRSQVLLAHLLLFSFVYPSDRHVVPPGVLSSLWDLSHEDRTDLPLCRGTLLSRAQYLVDVEQWGYIDARLIPYGNMTPHEIRLWTDAIDKESV